MHSRLVSLQFLSVDHNQLCSVPTEICHLINLTELHLADNQISRYNMELSKIKWPHPPTYVLAWYLRLKNSGPGFHHRKFVLWSRSCICFTLSCSAPGGGGTSFLVWIWCVVLQTLKPTQTTIHHFPDLTDVQWWNQHNTWKNENWLVGGK